jgi:hypothetical protein
VLSFERLRLVLSLSLSSVNSIYELYNRMYVNVCNIGVLSSLEVQTPLVAF